MHSTRVPVTTRIPIFSIASTTIPPKSGSMVRSNTASPEVSTVVFHPRL